MYIKKITTYIKSIIINHIYNVIFIFVCMYLLKSLTMNMIQHEVNVLNSEFSFSLLNCCTTVKEPSLLYYLPIAGGRIAGFMFF